MFSHIMAQIITLMYALRYLWAFDNLTHAMLNKLKRHAHFQFSVTFALSRVDKFASLFKQNFLT